MLNNMPTDGLALSGSLTVSQLNRQVAKALDETFSTLKIRGEISNLTIANSGHWYFTLKESGAAVRALMFRQRAILCGMPPKDGTQVEVRAKVSFYEARGDFQLLVDYLQTRGTGDLYEAFITLKNKLANEGLFDLNKKKALPYLPQSIGIITSTQGAALHDVLSTLKRRAPQVRLVIYASSVQGESAPLQLIQAIEQANQRQEVDLLLLCRGGGSLEDLWAFNDEKLARIIRASTIPIICGVGHETDFTIADLAGDLRAPTPTAAAELAVPSIQSLMQELSITLAALHGSVQRRYQQAAQTLDYLSQRLRSPKQQLAYAQAALLQQTKSLMSFWRRSQQQRDYQLQHTVGKLKTLVWKPQTALSHLGYLSARLVRANQQLLARNHSDLKQAQKNLEALAPVRTLARGYAIVYNPQGQIMRSEHEIQAGEILSIQFASDTAYAQAINRSEKIPTK